MNVEARPKAARPAAATVGVIDCDIHPTLRSPGAIKKYLPEQWRRHFDEYGGLIRGPFAGGEIYPRASPHLSRRDAYPPNGGPPGSDLAFMREQHLDPHNVEVGIMQVLGSGARERNVEYGAAVCSALNLWQIAEWTDREPRLKGSIAVPQEYSDGAVAEIRLHGRNPAFAQIALNQRTLEPLGRRRYWPVFAAAVDHDLTVGIHTGGYNGHSPVAGGGWPTFYAEQHHAINIAMQSVVTSLVMEGVFEEFPALRVVIIEGGFTWLPALSWRLDSLWRRMRTEVPRVKRPPSEYIAEHCWFTTQPMDPMGSPEELRQTIDWLGWDRLCFSSDYPHWDYDDTRYAFSFRLSEEERGQVFNRNAKQAYRLS